MGNGHEHEHAHKDSESHDGVTFNHEGTNYTVPLDAAVNSGLVGSSDRIQLPDGQLILLHPHGHEDNANDAKSIEQNGGKVWPIDASSP